MNKLFIFAGHSTQTPGACHYELKEHELAQDLVERINEYLLRQDVISLDITIQEFTDEKPEDYLRHRVELVNRYGDKKSLALDIHFNAYVDTSVGGTECWHYPKSSKGYTAAKLINVRLIKFFKDRGLKTSNKFYFLKRTKCPAVIVEVCFITSTEDIHTFLRKRDKIAKEIAQGVIDYFKVMEE